jgi:hypothetical protein
MTRAVKSATPPAPKGTTILMGLLGKFTPVELGCACNAPHKLTSATTFKPFAKDLIHNDFMTDFQMIF